MLKNKQNRRGFTLIELLVVVLIIGILASVALPMYQKAVEKTRKTQNIANMRALYDALEIYRLTNGDYPPAKNNTPGMTSMSYFNDMLGIDIPTTEDVYYYPKMFISQGKITMNWAVGGGPGKAILVCSAHPAYSTYEKDKNFCLSLCQDKQWRTWNHGEYCIL